MGHCDQESELKVRLSAEDAGAVAQKLGAPTARLRQENFFYETADDALAKAGLSLRVREQFALPDCGSPREIILTVKEAGVRAGALMVRPETECALARADWDAIRSEKKRFAELDLNPIRRLRERLPDFDALALQLLGTFETERDVYRYEMSGVKSGPLMTGRDLPGVKSGPQMTGRDLPGVKSGPQMSGLDEPGGSDAIEILLDKSFFPDGSVEWEVEVELPQAEAGRATRALRSLFSDLGVAWQPSKDSKYARLRRKIGRAVEGGAQARGVRRPPG
jgi:uncharacterized protein YjbK